jgi:hypothetical protein
MSILSDVGAFMGTKMLELKNYLDARIDTKIGSQTDQDIEITDSTKGIIFNSPTGKRYRVTIDDDGDFIKEEIT